MSLYSQRNIKKVLIGKSMDRTAAADVAGVLATPTLLANGELIVTDLSNNILDDTTVIGHDVIKIIQGRGANEPFRQEIIKLNEVTTYRGFAHASAVEQVSYVGFNGTSGSIEVVPNSLYFLRISRIFSTFERGNQLVAKYGQFNSTSTSTEQNIAEGLVKNLIANFKEEYKLEQDILFELVHSNAGAAITGAPTNFTVTKGSKTVSWTGTDPSNITAGDFIRLGGTTTTTPVYKVASVNLAGNTLTLDVAWQAASATILVANVEVITAALAAAGSFGIKMTGRPNKFDVIRWRMYSKLRWNITIDGAGATPITFATSAEDGLGTYEQVAMDEFTSWGNEGQGLIMQMPPLIPNQDAVSTSTYAALGIGFRNKVEHMVGAGENFGDFVLYFEMPSSENITGAAGGTSTVDVLDAFMTQRSDLTAQVSNL